MRVVLWTQQAQADLAAIQAFISQDSPHYAAVVVSRLISATDRLISFPESGRVVYRLVGTNELHVLTVHHSSQAFPPEL